MRNLILHYPGEQYHMYPEIMAGRGVCLTPGVLVSIFHR